MMPTMPPDTHKISLKVIEAVKQHPVLYISEVKSSILKLQEFRQKVWKRISDELGLDPTWVKLRWKNLRDTYCRILKYKNKTEKGVRRKKWIFEDHLNFLKFPYEVDYEPQCVVLSEEYVKEINDGGLSSDDLLEQLEDRNDEDYSEYLELEETTDDPILTTTKINKTKNFIESNEPPQKKLNITTSALEIESKYRKIRPKNHDESLDINTFNNILNSHLNNEKTLNIQNSKNFHQTKNLNNRKQIFITNPKTKIITKSNNNISNKNSNNNNNNNNSKLNEEINDEKLMKSSLELFFDSMAQTVKKLPTQAQADIKMDISRIVTNAESRFTKNSSTTNKREISKNSSLPKLVLIPCSMIDKQKN
ncbi:bromodomain-containing protein DDB_G0280777-like [Leptopilina boulardi]|uniref:bromodomain-containing protein DDB_G0280777-like n=1 Tax=Leptopilina boulardi TaxID=63433 RepID=UPI0021F61381|nr:bromodomain-containing protein DDB_G0280777-like [Leptopilina boulardi]